MPSKTCATGFSAQRRIRNTIEFKRVLDSSRVSNKWFVLYFCNNDQKHSRLGVVVSKRVLPKAVTRNFVKRLVREEFRQNVPAKTSLDMVVQLRRPINQTCSKEGRESLKDLLLTLQFQV